MEKALQSVIVVLPSTIYTGNSPHPYISNAGRVSQEVSLQFGGQAKRQPASLVRRGGAESHTGWRRRNNKEGWRAGQHTRGPWRRKSPHAE